MVALAMGARVIAMGRNVDTLKMLSKLSTRVHTVQITGDQEAETAALKKLGPIDAMLDLSPAMAAGSTHLRSGVLSLRRKGRVALMGGLTGDVALPHFFLMSNDISFQGKFMYEREDVVSFIRLLEGGMLDLSIVKVKGKYPLEKWAEAVDEAAISAPDEIAGLSP